MQPPPPPSHSSTVGALPLEESARRMGAYRWVESRLFEILGAWVATVPELDVKATLAVHAREHAWHAELWHEHLPRAGKMSPEGLTRPTNEDVANLFTAMAEPEGGGNDGTGRTIEKLVGAYRVLVPRMVVAYSAHLAACSAITDGPVIRALRLIVRDELEGWARGEAMIQSLLGTEAQVRRAADRQASLESMIAGAGLSDLAFTGSGLPRPGNGQP